MKERKRSKSLELTLLSMDFFKTFDSIYRGRMEEILLACGLTQRNCYRYNKSTKAMICPSYGDTTFFDIDAEVLQRDT